MRFSKRDRIFPHGIRWETLPSGEPLGWLDEEGREWRRVESGRGVHWFPILDGPGWDAWTNCSDPTNLRRCAMGRDCACDESRREAWARALGAGRKGL